MSLYYYQHIEHGYLVSYDEMIEIMRDEYEVDICRWDEYFFKTTFRIEGLEENEQLWGCW